MRLRLWVDAGEGGGSSLSTGRDSSRQIAPDEGSAEVEEVDEVEEVEDSERRSRPTLPVWFRPWPETVAERHGKIEGEGGGGGEVGPRPTAGAVDDHPEVGWLCIACIDRKKILSEWI